MIPSPCETAFLDGLHWRTGTRLRYPGRRLLEIAGVDFLVNGQQATCLRYFADDRLAEIVSSVFAQLPESELVHFKYCSPTAVHGLARVQVEEWEAPVLTLPRVADLPEWERALPYGLRRYIGSERWSDLEWSESRALAPDTFAILNLWRCACTIDEASWKAREGSDMRALEREDLQYLLAILHDHTNTSLLVLHHGDTPAAWSLMMRSRPGTSWYAVKWGCSDEGRKRRLGLLALIAHLRLLASEGAPEGTFRVDFWGRSSEIYDKLKTDSLRRGHLTVLRPSGRMP